MIKREFDATFINSVANHPSVREGAKVQGFTDIQDLINDYRNHPFTIRLEKEIVKHLVYCFSQHLAPAFF